MTQVIGRKLTVTSYRFYFIESLSFPLFYPFGSFLFFSINILSLGKVIFVKVMLLLLMLLLPILVITKPSVILFYEHV